MMQKTVQTSAKPEKPEPSQKPKKSKKPSKALAEKLLTDEERVQIRATARGRKPIATGGACGRCGLPTQEWPIKDLDKGHAPAVSIAPDDRAFLVGPTAPNGQRIARRFCAKCLRQPGILERALAGKSIKSRVKATQEGGNS